MAASRVDGDPEGVESRQRRHVPAQAGRAGGQLLGVPDGGTHRSDLMVLKASLGRLDVIGVDEVEGVADEIPHLPCPVEDGLTLMKGVVGCVATLRRGTFRVNPARISVLMVLTTSVVTSRRRRSPISGRRWRSHR